MCLKGRDHCTISYTKCHSNSNNKICTIKLQIDFVYNAVTNTGFVTSSYLRLGGGLQDWKAWTLIKCDVWEVSGSYPGWYYNRVHFLSNWGTGKVLWLKYVQYSKLKIHLEHVLIGKHYMKYHLSFPLCGSQPCS